jgi:hypothetical protein
LYKVDVTIPADATDVFVYRATVTGKDPGKNPVSESVATRIGVTPLIVTLTPPNQQTVGSVFVLTGTVNDPAITSVTVDHNGVLTSVSVTNGTYQSTISLANGINMVTVRATKSGGKSAAAGIEFTQANVP